MYSLTLPQKLENNREQIDQVQLKIERMNRHLVQLHLREKKLKEAIAQKNLQIRPSSTDTSHVFV